jgi:hypothetical protein
MDQRIHEPFQHHTARALRELRRYTCRYRSRKQIKCWRREKRVKFIEVTSAWAGPIFDWFTKLQISARITFLGSHLPTFYRPSAASGCISLLTFMRTRRRLLKRPRSVPVIIREAGEPGDRRFAFRKGSGREESPDSIVVNSKEPSTKGNAPGNARGWRGESAHGRFGCAATESATENKPPV